MKRQHTIVLDRYYLVIISISLVVSVLIHFPEIISLFHRQMGEEDRLFPNLTLSRVVSEVSFSFLSLLVLFAINYVLLCMRKSPGRIGFRRIIVAVLITWLLSNILGKAFVFLHQQYGIPAIDALLHHYLHPMRDFIITGIVVGSCYIVSLIRQRQQMLLENEQLRTENMVNQFEVLKNQLNPHMLFNSLNTLQSLVRDMPEKADEYIRQLSRVLRYTLRDNDQRLSSLTGEMEFVNAYIFLQKMRYEENLNFEIKIDKDSQSMLLPPMSIQTLIENAIKHNQISKSHPLSIRVSSAEKGWISVSNNFQPKLTVNSGSGIGLANLSKRYELLFRKEIIVHQDNDAFTVSIPLIPASV